MYILAAISFSFNFGLTLMLFYFYFIFLLLCDLFAVYINLFLLCNFYRIIFLCSYSCQPCFFLFVFADFLINLPKYRSEAHPMEGTN